MSTLVIVESPTKAKTITRFLGRDFVVRSSFGHVRDLPKKDLGVDVDKNFEPHYVVSRDKQKIVKELKTLKDKADDVLFATDEDREGEAISWHLAHILGIKPKDTKRIVFHEITKPAILAALEKPRFLDLKLVDAQQARRILDRLVGYELSPFLWKKVAKGLSAGRVQSVAVRLVVEREREIEGFKPQEYWTVVGDFTPSNRQENFIANLHSWKNKKLDKFDLNNKEQVDEIVKALGGATYKVGEIEEKLTKRNPLPPFTTSTLQQAANSRLGFSAKQTMMLAQQLYEGVEVGSEGSVGLITYMRTDAVNLSEKFLNDAKAEITSQFGAQYALETPRFYKNKSKNAQEAHEAIRPTEAARSPEVVKPFLNRNQYRLYDLIWRRAVATQMAQAQLNSSSVSIDTNKDCQFRAIGKTIVFPGFLKLYPDSSKENILPVLTTGEDLNCLSLKPEQHFTEPPARYSDATLVKSLEEYGIGRPSTYAPTIHTIEARGYVERDENKRLKPKDIARVVNDLLVEHFPQIVDFQFTARMEEDLDEVARGKKEWQPLIKDFYTPFKENLINKTKELQKKDITETATNEVCDKCGAPMVEKIGRYGKFLACTGYPKCKNTKRLNGNGEIAAPKPAPEMTDEKCDKCGAPMVKRTGRYGPFLACSAFPKCKNIKNIADKSLPSTGVKCPSCGQGEIVPKRSRRGMFYACNRYPDCKTAFSHPPTGEQCPECKSPLVILAEKGIVKCSSKDCEYKREQAV